MTYHHNMGQSGKDLMAPSSADYRGPSTLDHIVMGFKALVPAGIGAGLSYPLLNQHFQYLMCQAPQMPAACNGELYRDLGVMGVGGLIWLGSLLWQDVKARGR